MLNILKSHFVFTPLASKSKVIYWVVFTLTVRLCKITARNLGWAFFSSLLFFVGEFLIYKNIIHVQSRISMLVEKIRQFLFFSLTFFLPLGNIDSRITSRTIWSYHDLMDQVLWIFVSIPWTQIRSVRLI